MLPNNHVLDIMSEKLRRAVVATLSLKEAERVFVGNEEKMFLLALFQHMPNSSHSTAVKIKNYKELTFYKMMDIWKGEIEKRPKTKQSQPLSERIRHFAIAIRALLIKIKHLVFLKSKLQHASVIIHYTAHLRYASFTVPGLTSLYFKHKEKKDEGLRKIFFDNLNKVGFEPILVEYLTSLFPTSHLESYSKFTAHKISNVKKIDTVVTSLAGIMDDPLLSFLVKNNNCKLIYVQHGGGYGLNKNHQAFRIEDGGADLMYYWGTGGNNVYPTRYRDKYFSKMRHQAVIILSDKKDEKTIKPYVRTAEKVANKLQATCIVVAHPNGPKFDYKNIQYGIGYRQHEKAQLVVYDNIAQSLIYARILSKRPFLIIEGDSVKLAPQSDNAFKFISLLQESGILIPLEELEYKMNYWMQFSPKEAEREFEEKAQLIFNHVLNQPKIQNIFDI
jgi:hypothetical protein